MLRNRREKYEIGVKKRRVSVTEIWLEKTMYLLLGDFKGAFDATQRLRRRAMTAPTTSSSISALSHHALDDILSLMSEMSDLLSRGNIAHVLVATSNQKYVQAIKSLDQFETNCGKGTAIQAFGTFKKNIGKDAIFRNGVMNGIVCKCIERFIWK